MFSGPQENFRPIVIGLYEHYKKFGRVFALHLGMRPNLVVTEPEDYERILSNNKHNTKVRPWGECLESLFLL